MSDWYIGGMTVTGSGWGGPRAVYLDFQTPHTGFLFQLYACRRLIGQTSDPLARRIYGQLQETGAPTPLTLVRVVPGAVLEDFGPLLPRLAWNRFVLGWDAETYPGDAVKFEITGALAAGGAVDPANVVATEPYTGDGHYSRRVPPLTDSGLWSFEITPRDNATPSGNAGTAVSKSVNALVLPPDVALDAEGNRFSLSAVGGVLTAEFQYG